MGEKERYGVIFTAKNQEIKDLLVFSEIGEKGLRTAARSLDRLDLNRRINELLGDPPEFKTPEEYVAAQDAARGLENFSKTQQALDNSYLYELCLTRLWTILESFVDELIVEALRNPAACEDKNLLAKLKGPLVELLSATEDERAEFLAQCLKLEVDASLKKGIGRFESLLSPVGFGGKVHAEVKKALLELGQVRNLVVHKSAIVDRQFLQSCPWVNLQKGDRLVVSGATFSGYLHAVWSYLIILRVRVSRRLHIEHGPEEANGLLERMLEKVQGRGLSCMRERSASCASIPVE